MLVSRTVHWLFADAAGLAGDPPAWPSSLSGPPGHRPVQLLREALDLHRGWPLLARRGGRIPGLPVEISAEAVSRRQRAVMEHLVVENDLAMVAETFDAAGLAWACLKGPVLDEAYRRRGESRSYGDLDVLVAPGSFHAALTALGERGVGLRDRNWRLMREQVPGEVDLLTGRRTVIDLHWSLVNQSARRSRLRLPSADLLSRAVRVDLGGVVGPVPTLSPPDALVHLCLHAAASGGMKLTWLLDVTLAASDPDLDWDETARTARAWGTERATALVLGRAARHLGAPVPRATVRALQGHSGWGVADAAVQTSAALWSATPPASARHLARGSLESDNVVRMLLARARRRMTDPTPREPFVPGPTHPGSALYPSGTPEDLTHYLRTVTAMGTR
ncbi:nucleotidyltransferase family protein [Nocardioides flavescens]|uniref:nucleotidyltransferase family protein n=1 Tax=Nocardioides flavescens TaxID=2691959 RepID=UPI00301DF8FE